jgi:hypothetical protein
VLREPGRDRARGVGQHGGPEPRPARAGRRRRRPDRPPVPEHREPDAGRFVEEPAVVEPRLVEDLSDGRRRVVAQAGPQRRLREREDLGPPFGERAVALGATADRA